MAARGPNLARRPLLFGSLSTSMYIETHRAPVFVWSSDNYLWTVFGPLWLVRRNNWDRPYPENLIRNKENELEYFSVIIFNMLFILNQWILHKYRKITPVICTACLALQDTRQDAYSHTNTHNVELFSLR